MATASLFSTIFGLLAMQITAVGSHAHDLTSCLAAAGVHNVTMYPSAAYYDMLGFSIQNLRFMGADTPKPAAVVVPTSRDQLRDAIRCARAAGLVVRLRCGGHSYEGLSYTIEDHSAFVVVDLMTLNRVRVEPESKTAWVEAGATLGEVYHAISEFSLELAFSAGSCPTVGSGGHIAGGGFGLLSRKYGLAADNVINAILITADGRVLDRVSMGEDVFWAIRGGGGGGWGAVYAWCIKLNPVPQHVTVFAINQHGSIESIAQLVAKWQRIAPWLPDEFYLSVFVGANLPESNWTGISVTFKGFYLGPSDEAIQILIARFPEIGLSDLDPKEMSWIESIVFFSGLPEGSSLSDLKDRALKTKNYFKAKSDYMHHPMSIDDLIKTIDFLSMEPKAYLILDPYGGAMDRIGPTTIPFPHRRGNIHSIQYMIEWTTDDDGHRQDYIDWLHRFYDFMGVYVSKDPRTAYINYLDLDLGMNKWSDRWGDGGDGCMNPEVEAARVWGEKYFLGNYDRLVRAKTTIDQENVFRNAQSIPPLRPGMSRNPRGISSKVASKGRTCEK